MTGENRSVERREARTAPEIERTRDRRVHVPYVDIYRNGEALFLLADMPGVDEKGVSVDLENGVLTVRGRVEDVPVEGHSRVLTEYETGDYERSFTLSDEIDGSRIEASIRDGVLRLVMPLAEEAKPRKIEVKAG